MEKFQIMLLDFLIKLKNMDKKIISIFLKKDISSRILKIIIKLKKIKLIIKNLFKNF